MIRFTKNLLTTLICLGLIFPAVTFADPMKFHVGHKPSKSDYIFHSYKRYKQNPVFNRFPDYSPNFRSSHIYWAPKKHKRRFKPNVIYVVPKGSNVLIYGGNRDYHWKDRYYQPALREGKKAHISVNLNF